MLHFSAPVNGGFCFFYYLFVIVQGALTAGLCSKLFHPSKLLFQNPATLHYDTAQLPSTASFTCKKQ